MLSYDNSRPLSSVSLASYPSPSPSPGPAEDGPAAAGRHPRAQAARAVGQEAQVLRLQRHRSRVIPRHQVGRAPH